MKKISILILGFIYSTLSQAQNIEESSYTEKNKIMESLSFSIPICNKDVLINTWKNFIKKQGGKIKGGVINKVYGSDIKFSPSGESWIGNFAYEYNDNKTMTVFTSFQDMSNTYINSNISEKDIAIPVLENFKLDVQKSCTLDDLTYAKSYSIKLNKDKIRNSDKIFALEKTLQEDYKNVSLKSNQDISDKERENINKIKDRIIINEGEIQTLKNRNLEIDKELISQSMVIQGFQNSLDLLEGKVLSDDSNENLNHNENKINISSNQHDEEEINGIDQDINDENDIKSPNYFDNH